MTIIISKAKTWGMTKALRSTVVALAATVLFVTAVLLPSASAHTAMLRASPDRNATAGGAIQFVDLEFLDPVTNAAVSVTYNGMPVAGRATVTNGELITFSLDQPLTEPGRYQVNYEMTSFDSDFTTGGYFFSFDPTAAQPARIELLESGGFSTATLIASAAGLLLLLGLVALFVRRIDDHRNQRLLDVADDPSTEDYYR